MTTRQRNLSSSTIFHVLNRGVDRQDIFWTDEDRRSFLGHLGERAKRHSVQVLAYALMSNHYHAIVEIGDGDLPAMMRDFQSGYARRLNWRTKRTGPLFEDRYTSVPITTDAQLVQEVRYVHRNPISITGSDHLLRWKWSSLAVSIGVGRGPAWLRTDLLQQRMECSGHLRNVIEPQPSDRLPFAWIAPLRRTDFDELARLVDLACGTSPRSRRNLVLSLLADRFRAASPDVVAEYLGLAVQTARNLRSEARARLAIDAAFQSTVDAVLTQLG